MDHPVMLKITSAAFAHGGNIPPVYTCEGEDKNPPLEIDGIPEAAQTLALVMDDPDAPKKTFDHWIIWNIPPNRVIAEDSQPGRAGKNSLGENGYTGPCPPSGTHRYFFKVYALDCSLDLPANTDKKALEVAIQNHILAYGELMGKYQKKSH